MASEQAENTTTISRTQLCATCASLDVQDCHQTGGAFGSIKATKLDHGAANSCSFCQFLIGSLAEALSEARARFGKSAYVQLFMSSDGERPFKNPATGLRLNQMTVQCTRNPLGASMYRTLFDIEKDDTVHAKHTYRVLADSGSFLS